MTGIDFKQKIVNLDGVPIKLQIWDTAGEERFRTLTTAYYRGAQGIVLMYDNASPEVVKVLTGNKCEVINHQRAVDKDRGAKLAESFDMPFFEVSCRNDINVQETFLALARGIRDLRERRISLFECKDKENENVRLGDNDHGSWSNKCASC
ncbi:Ras-related protein RABE1a [Armadillidium vulgare]|nr:Ras-related protein RABE1a [Armadillidium vulgare]